MRTRPTGRPQHGQETAQHRQRSRRSSLRRGAWQGRALGALQPLPAWGRSVGREQGEALAGALPELPLGAEPATWSWKQLWSALPRARASTLCSSSLTRP